MYERLLISKIKSVWFCYLANIFMFQNQERYENLVYLKVKSVKSHYYETVAVILNQFGILRLSFIYDGLLNFDRC